MINDTIVALTTAPMEAALGLIRISGPKTFDIASSIFSNYHSLGENRRDVIFGHIVDKTNNQVIDEVVVTLFKKPHSFTGEDTMEITCHGGLIVINNIIQLCIKYGARMANRGEFSQKAFYNGKIDLIQAESINDLITAKTDEAAGLALTGLSGNVSKMIENIKLKMIEIMAHIEVNIDYPEYDDISVLDNTIIGPMVNDLIVDCENILKEAHIGKVIKNGVKVAIIGRPNVGKSSLLNALIKEDKAIVTSVAGTTRDIVEGTSKINGINFIFLDTAGIHNSSDIVESIGIKKSRQAILDADLVLVVIDGSTKMTSEDQELIDSVVNKPHIIVINKDDLEAAEVIKIKGVRTCAKNGEVAQLEEEMSRIVGIDIKQYKNQALLSNSRQIGLLMKSLESLKIVAQSCIDSLPTDLIAIDLKQSLDNIMEIRGEKSMKDFDDEIFSKFCVGK